MPKVNYYLQSAKSAETYIRLVFNYPAGRLVYYPGEKVRSAHWNAEAQRLRKNAPGAVEINAGLDILEGKVLEIFRRFRNDGLPLPPDRFRAELDAAHKGRLIPAAERVTLLEFWERLAEERRVSPNYSANTFRAYVTALRKVQAYAASVRRRLDLDSITMDFHGSFTAWMSKQGHSPNFMHKVVQVLKVVMGEAHERGLHQNMFFRSGKFTVKTFEPEHIYLTENEIAAIAALNLPPGRRLDKARDLFLLGCYTGLRFSDYSQVKAENIGEFDGVPMLTIQTRKTRTRTAIPLSLQSRALLDKNGGQPPKALAGPVLNRAIKEVCRLAGITEPVRIVAVKGGQRVETVSDKCDLVSSHTARRSFGTNEYVRALREGRAWRPIMDILGMTKEATFFRYVKVKQEETAAAFARARGG